MGLPGSLPFSPARARAPKSPSPMPQCTSSVGNDSLAPQPNVKRLHESPHDHDNPSPLLHPRPPSSTGPCSLLHFPRPRSGHWTLGLEVAHGSGDHPISPSLLRSPSRDTKVFHLIHDGSISHPSVTALGLGWTGSGAASTDGPFWYSELRRENRESRIERRVND